MYIWMYKHVEYLLYIQSTSDKSIQEYLLRVRWGYVDSFQSSAAHHLTETEVNIVII